MSSAHTIKNPLPKGVVLIMALDVTHIQNLPMGEAMIYGVNETQVLGLAVGGIFETTELGPKHCFWINEDIYSAAAAG